MRPACSIALFIVFAITPAVQAEQPKIGELYKCTETVGDPNEVVGNLADWPRGDDRMHKWLAYDPFADAECRACKSLPVCMGGCAYHSMDPDLHDSRCSTCRFTHEQQVRHLIARTTRSA